MEENNYPAYFTSRFEYGQVVRGDEGISVMLFNLVSDNHNVLPAYWCQKQNIAY